MRMHRYLALAALFAAIGCSSSGGRNEATRRASSEPVETVDDIYAKRFALESFEKRLDQTQMFHAAGNAYLFRATRDSLVSDVNAYIRANPHAEEDVEFARLLNHLSILDTLRIERPSAPEGYSAQDDSLALMFADWPDIDIKLEDGRLFSSYNTIFPVIEDKRIDFWIKYFTGPGKERFERAIYRMELYRPTVEAILNEKDMPRELICVALIESGFSMKAVSYAQAVGPWQFIRGTGKIYGLRTNWWIDERRDIVASTYAACNYLRDLYGIWGDWYLALAAYNCGEYRVARQIARQRTEDFWRLDLPRQTERYVPKFLAALYILREPHKYGIEIPNAEPLTFDIVTIKDATDLKVVARCAGTSAATIQELNPHMFRWATPPRMEVHIKVPAGDGEMCQLNLDNIPPEERITWRRHKVKRGETLSQIASRYGTSVRALKDLNKIRNSHMIREGYSLLVPMKGGTYAEVASASSSPRYKSSTRTINKQSLNNYAKKAAPPAGYKRVVYTVKDNDTLGEIAESYRTSARKIRAWNDLSYRRYIYPGQKLAIYVPESSNTPSRSVAEIKLPDETCCTRQNHVVKKGDSFYSISKNYDVSLSEVLAWNNKSRRSVIRPGDVVYIWKEKQP